MLGTLPHIQEQFLLQLRLPALCTPRECLSNATKFLACISPPQCSSSRKVTGKVSKSHVWNKTTKVFT